MKLPGIKSQQGKDTKTLETIELFRGIVICYSLQFNRIMWSGQDPYQRILMGPGGNNPMSGYDIYTDHVKDDELTTELLHAAKKV